MRVPDDTRDDDELSRRELLTRMGASLALAGLMACERAPKEKIVPYGVKPPEVTPGVPSFYATAWTLDGYATGLLVESHEGRPTKIEGNPEHPASLGATGIFEQALILELYDRSRARAIRRGRDTATWRGFQEHVVARSATSGGRGVHFVMEPVSSPLLVSQIAAVRARLPGATFHFHTPLSRSAVWEGARMALGAPLETKVDLAAADVVLALDACFLGGGPGSLPLARRFADRRRVRGTRDEMNRLYVAEPQLSVTGGMADHRARLSNHELLRATASLVAALSNGHAPESPFFQAALRDLVAHRGSSVVLVGDRQPARLHAMGHVLNRALGNVGRTVEYIESPIFEAGTESHGLTRLTMALDAGEVDALVILEGNPLYNAPADLELARRVRSAREVVYLGLFENETARAATWFLPAAHTLEAWGDARAYDGTTSLVQPLLAPLHDGHTPSEVLAVFQGETERSGYELLRASWRAKSPASDFEARWNRALERGIIDGPSPAVPAPPLAPVADAPLEPPSDALELCFRPDARVHDGRYTNNGWLLELPDPVTKLTWGNAALLAPRTAARFGVASEDVVEIRHAGRSLRAPVLVVAGQAENTVVLPLGYGRSGAEALADGVGVNAYLLRRSSALDCDRGATLARTGERFELAQTQAHFALEGRDEDILPHRTLAEYRAAPAFTEPKQRPLTLYPSQPTAPRQWGMTIDLNVCTGCSVCVVACQAENNIPIVGKKGVQKGREMHWIRIDRYADGPPDDPRVLVQPMLCQHCEKAPCEYVCPTNATVHSADGLNQMVYNRCVGTRFCSNNCPYKVRRFNWFNYTHEKTATEQLAMNPDVTVRARGVMEKCTYCVQRIRQAEIREIVGHRPLADGDIRTACQQACPTSAIRFGDLRDPRSEVARLTRNDRAYSALSDLGTVPRTRYLAKLSNPNPEIR
jgi:molybdopterin-containing oxidoreductase family iron-sulfur binding subunit